MIEFHVLAVAEAKEAQAWYAARSRQAATSFLRQLRAAITRIDQTPEQFAEIRKNYRYARVAGFPYMVVFRPQLNGTLLVVAIAHTSRKCGYWSKRD